jgi:hypothetical protein
MPILNNSLNRIKIISKNYGLGGGASQRILTYWFESDDDFDHTYHEKIVDKIMLDYDHWEPANVQFRQGSSKKESDILIHLCTEERCNKICKMPGFSCAEVGGKNVYLNGKNWMNGASKSKLTLAEYRRYALSHEVCHCLGYLHEDCPAPGKPVGLMSQATRGHGINGGEGEQCVPTGGKVIFHSHARNTKIHTQWDDIL